MALVRLRQRLQEHPMSQAALGRKIGVPRQRVNDWASEICEPTIAEACAMARVLNTTVEDLAGL